MRVTTMQWLLAANAVLLVLHISISVIMQSRVPVSLLVLSMDSGLIVLNLWFMWRLGKFGRGDQDAPID